MPPLWNWAGMESRDAFKLLKKRPDLNVINMAGLPGLLKWSFISMRILENAPPKEVGACRGNRPLCLHLSSFTCSPMEVISIGDPTSVSFAGPLTWEPWGPLRAIHTWQIDFFSHFVIVTDNSLPSKCIWEHNAHINIVGNSQHIPLWKW